MEKNNHSIVRHISILYRYGQSYFTKSLDFLAIGSGQYVFLMTLYRKGAISQEELSNYLKIDKGTTAKAIKKLEDEGYVIREVDSRDRRAYKIFLTQKGIEAIPSIQAAAKDWEKILTAGFSEVERHWVEQTLQRMAENAYNFKIENEETENEKS